MTPEEPEEYTLIVDGVGVPVTGRWSSHTPTRSELRPDGRLESAISGPSVFECDTTREAAEALSAAHEHGRPVPFAFLGDSQPILGYLRVKAVTVGANSGHVTFERHQPERW